MKEFKSAVEDIVAEDEREAAIEKYIDEHSDRLASLLAEGKTQTEAEKIVRSEAETEVDGEEYVEFTLDGRVMKAFKPDDTQLAFMLASLGRGQTKEGRFAAILNIMFESLEDDDKDYLESRMITGSRSRRVPMKVIEGIFEYLMEEWFRETVPGRRKAVRASV